MTHAKIFYHSVGGGVSHVVRIKLEVLDSFVRLPVPRRTRMMGMISSLIFTRKMEMWKHTWKREREMALPPESGQKRSDRDWVTLLETQHLCRVTHPQTRLVTFQPDFFVFAQLLQKCRKVAVSGSQEATTSTLAAQHRQYSQQWSGMEDTVLAAAFWHGKVISRQQNKPFQMQTNYMAWGVGVQPHVYHHWFCRVSLQHIWFHSPSPQDV